MAANTKRVLIETIVRKTLREIQEAPERSIRNLVDLALHFSKGHFQTGFFQGAQRMLTNEHSAYYQLVRNTVSYVEHERLLRFGMNIGYNSCTLGAEKIRQIEEAERFNIPWALFLELDDETFAQHQHAYDSLICRGKELGIHTWFVTADSITTDMLELLERHDDCAFVLLCNAVSADMLDELDGLNHILLSVVMNEDTDRLCTELRRRKLLYAIHKVYSSDDLKDILNDNMIYDTQSSLAPFTALIPAAECTTEDRRLVFDYVLRKRAEQEFPTILWDMMQDVLSIDTIVSEDSCSAGFRADGSFFALASGQNAGEWNMFRHDLKDILASCFKK